MSHQEASVAWGDLGVQITICMYVYIYIYVFIYIRIFIFFVMLHPSGTTELKTLLLSGLSSQPKKISTSAMGYSKQMLVPVPQLLHTHWPRPALSSSISAISVFTLAFSGRLGKGKGRDLSGNIFFLVHKGRCVSKWGFLKSNKTHWFPIEVNLGDEKRGPGGPPIRRDKKPMSQSNLSQWAVWIPSSLWTHIESKAYPPWNGT